MSSSTQNQSPSSIVLQEEEEAYCSALYLRTINAFTHALSTSMALGLFDIIGRADSNSSLTATEIAAQLNPKKPDLASDVIDRLLRLLTCYDLLSCSLRSFNGVERQYRLAPTGLFFVRNMDGESSSLPPSWEDAWYKLEDSILEGDKIPFEKANGVPMYKCLESNPKLMKSFNKGMDGISSYIMKKILDKYNGFKEIKTLVDIGGGSGLTLQMILSKYPNTNAINFDLPDAIKDAPSHSGVMHVGGDMFMEIPSADAIMMKDVLHNWSDEECIKILKNCYNALPKGGKVIVVSYMMGEVGDESNIAAKFVCHMDIMMYVYLGGKQRTEKEFKTLSKIAGFSGFQLVCYVAYNTVGIIEFYK